MPSSSFLRELTEGLTRFCSICEIVELVNPLRRASSRWEGEKVASNSIRALVLVPTRELAEQVHNNVREYAENLPLSTYAVYGGVSINPQMMRLRRGVDLLVATPGRLLDLFRQNAVKFNQVQTLVLDEADRMLDLALPKNCSRYMRRCRASARRCCSPPRSPSRFACLQGWR